MVTGAAYRTPYELYAHERVAEGVGLARRKIATIAAGYSSVSVLPNGFAMPVPDGRV